MTQTLPQKLIFIDAETAFDVLRLNADDQGGADPSNIAEIVRAAQALFRRDIKVVLMVQSSAGLTEDQSVTEFNAKETQLNAFFFDNKQIVSKLPPEKSSGNIYANVLRHANVNARSALFVTPLEEIDADVTGAGIAILQAGPRQSMWHVIKNFALN